LFRSDLGQLQVSTNATMNDMQTFCQLRLTKRGTKMKTLTRCGRRFVLRILLVLVPVLSVFGLTVCAEESGLVFEGHVPAAHITALIADHGPDDKGLAVPGMPGGSPGMEMGSRKDPYAVLLLTEKSKATVFARENGPVR
jgi:hypothetical protein